MLALVLGIFLVAVLLVYIFVWWKKVPLRLTLKADEACELIFQKSQGKTAGLPDKMKGVFWMSTNVGQELLVSLDGSPFDAEKHELRMFQGSTYQWSRSTNFGGWALWLNYTVTGTVFGGETRFQWSDATYMQGRIYAYFCRGCCWCPVPQTWTMDDISPDPGSGNLWDRGIYCWCVPGVNCGGYKLVKVMDKDGKRMQPEFDQMMQSLSPPGVPDIPQKTLTQYVQGDIDLPKQQEMTPLV